MPSQKFSGRYPADWDRIAAEVKAAAGWRCIRCSHPHDPASGHTLTVHHMTNDKSEPASHWWAFLALCQKCHLQVQAKINLNRPWIFEHSEWIKPYIAGWYAYRYLGLELSRPEVENRLDEFLALEVKVTLGLNRPLPLTGG